MRQRTITWTSTPPVCSGQCYMTAKGENMERKSPKISALRFLFGLVAASWKYRITSNTFCCPTCLLPTKRLNRWSFEIIIMSLREWELKIHLCLSLVLKSPLWILFPAYLKLNYLSDFCSSSSGMIVLLPSVPGDLSWPKCNRSHKVQDETSQCWCWLDQWTLTFTLPLYRNSFSLEPRFPNNYLDSCLTTSQQLQQLILLLLHWLFHFPSPLNQ